jgi:uncharacterized membrane protein YhdT
MKRRLFFIALAVALILLALVGWVIAAFKPKRRTT